MSHLPTTETGPLNSTADPVVSHTAQFQTRWLYESTAVVCAHGELDAANSTDFIDYTMHQTRRAKNLVLDLSDLSFFATAGFSALHTLNVQCVKQQTPWSLAAGRAVQRVLRICDPDITLPVCDDVDEALRAVRGDAGHDDPPRLLHLVSQPR